MERYTVDLQQKKGVRQNGCLTYSFCLDCVKKDGQWGRLHMEGTFPQKGIVTLSVIGTNGPPPANRSAEQGCRSFVNQRDILLYGIRGRYLWVYIEIPEGEEAADICRVCIYNPGDRFLQTFPEIYQEPEGIFHRYLSILSTLYEQFQEQIDCAGDLLDLNKAPQELLPLIGSWLGIDCRGGGLEEERRRELLRWGYRLNRMKGTRAGITRVTEIILGEIPTIIEKEPEKIIILLRQDLTESKELLLLFYLNQFKTAGSRLHIVSYQDVMGMDEYCYMDVNAGLWRLPHGVLDGEPSVDQAVLG